MKNIKVIKAALEHRIEYLNEIVDLDDQSTYLPDVENKEELKKAKYLHNILSNDDYNDSIEFLIQSAIKTEKNRQNLPK